MEGIVYPGNPDTLRFYGPWNNQPEMSLDRKGFEYQAAEFVRYLSTTHGPEFVSKVWMSAGPDETPFDVIPRLLQANPLQSAIFSSAEPNVPDVYFSRFCRDSYFPETFGSPGFAPELSQRHGPRALTESFDLPRSGGPPSYSLDHLACRYFTLYPSLSSSTIVVKIQTPMHRGQTFIKASVTTVDDWLRPIQHRWLAPSTADLTSPVALLDSGPLSIASPRVDHVVVCVVNCAYVCPTHMISPRLVDSVDFQLIAECC
jgi:hypothetical protein